MSLFVGNISRNASERDIEKSFERFGDCHIRFRGAYGFIEFKSEQDAEDAKEKL
jgi:RNA recognition motif-containing protein